MVLLMFTKQSDQMCKRHTQTHRYRDSIHESFLYTVSFKGGIGAYSVRLLVKVKEIREDG